ncbi:MAG: acyl-[ACP]--phospholipid O-acyltransferase [Alphaproteobacteria bacterium]|nr:MAG: acyl-[ACP]--phospholipid O-acyltransferase [Alphaproteobacteria bacterium]
MASQWKLLGTKRFLPLFVVQFLGALNDNIIRNSLSILVTYKLAIQQGIDPTIYVNIIGGAFVVPYVFFSATAGYLADHVEKSRIIRAIKFAEILFAVMASYFFAVENINGLVFVLCLFGLHSTFFGPVKFSILPDHLRESELIGGNALVEMGTFVGIVVGTVLAGLSTTSTLGTTLVSVLLITVAIVGYVASLYVPKSSLVEPSEKLSFNIFAHTRQAWGFLWQRKMILRAVMGISWFWFVGAILLTQLTVFSQRVIGGNEHVLTLFLTTCSLGIGAGSLVCHRLVKGRVDQTFVPLACLGMSLFGFDLVMAANNIPLLSSELLTLETFLSMFNGWRLLLDMLLVSMCSGVFIVPLYAFVQSRALPSQRSRIIAANNIMNGLFMILAAVMAGAFAALGFSTVDVYFVLAILNLVIAAYTTKLLPKALIRSILRSLFDVLFRTKIEGFENFLNVKSRAVIVSNHQSYLDGIIFWVYFGDSLIFAVNTIIARNPIISWFLDMADCYLIDASNPMTVKTLIQQVKNGKKLVIFPEGRLTLTGALMKVYTGPGMIADHAQAAIIPVSLNGLQYTPFAMLKGVLPQRWFPKIRITIKEPVELNIPHDYDTKTRRELINMRLYDIMSEVVYISRDIHHTLFTGVLNAQSLFGKNKKILEDASRKPISYSRLVRSSFVLGEVFRSFTKCGENVGILMPNVIPAAATFYGLQAIARVPAMLNFSAGPGTVVSCCKISNITHVITSRKFVEAAKLGPTVGALTDAGLVLHFLEDLTAEMSLRHKLTGLMKSFFPRIGTWLSDGDADPHDPAVILFTSGSENFPKGVVLSHLNVNANRAQMLSRIDFTPADRFFNALPVFHSFGLVAGMLLPLSCGIRTFLYSSPLHYRIIPELIYDIDATVMFGTNTFLSGYAQQAHPYDFYSVRYIFAGAEKLHEDVRRTYAERFGVRVLEGYGTTETSPVLTFNTPMHNKPGSVGRFLPGIAHTLEKVPGIKNAGRLHVKSANVMLGYYLIGNPGKIIPPKDGWYDTGDIVSVDNEGFVSIKGRAKRFAKVGGEMISLTAVEEVMAKLWSDTLSAVVARPDPVRGEQIIAITVYKDATLRELGAFIRARGYGEIYIPRDLKIVDELPLLGSGKIDYVALNAKYSPIPG